MSEVFLNHLALPARATGFVPEFILILNLTIPLYLQYFPYKTNPSPHSRCETNPHPPDLLGEGQVIGFPNLGLQAVLSDEC
jgi:hypothetical protein